MDMAEKCLRRETLFQGMITLRRDRVLLPGGRETERTVVEHPGAAAVVALDPEGRLVMVLQYRYPIGSELLEIPAGKLDPGEAPRDCAMRELAEETGFMAASLIPLGTMYTTPGFCDEQIHLFWASGLSPAGAGHALDPDELLKVELLAPPVALKMAGEGRISDAKTVCGILMAAQRGLL